MYLGLQYNYFNPYLGQTDHILTWISSLYLCTEDDILKLNLGLQDEIMASSVKQPDHILTLMFNLFLGIPDDISNLYLGS